ncbi:hypothetical protein V6N13_041162 [Hibiscus sabdariffa]
MVQAGNKPYNIHVSEIGFSDPTRDPLLLKRKVLEADKAKQEVESLLDSSTEESGRSLPELSRIRKNKLLELEIIIVSGMNKLIKRSTQRKKERDRAIRQEKKKSKRKETLEISGKSLEDSCLVYIRDLLIREARKAFELGKSLGVQIGGEESEAVRDIARLEEDPEALYF